MFPKINFDQLVGRLSPNKSSDVRGNMVPIMPPRTSNFEMLDGVPNVSNKESWYVIISPRETKGVAGPFSVNDLKRMFLHKEITDRTLCWEDGDNDWRQIIHHPVLKSKLISIPIAPPRVGTYNEELNVFDPTVELPPLISDEKLRHFELSKVDRYCFRCGNLATSHIIGTESLPPDLFKCREDVGSTRNSSEILPGFLWIGDASSAKKATIMQLGATLIINCTANMKSPQADLPNFRCRDLPVPEKPMKTLSLKEKEDIFALFERAFDWIEMERIDPSKGKLVEIAPSEIGQFNPVKRENRKLRALRASAAAKSPSSPNAAMDHEVSTLEKPTSRVLLWSRLGTDRACLIAAAYLIKSYCISATSAVEIITRQRMRTAISPQYLNLLDVWAARYSIGATLCIDCTHAAVAKGSEHGRSSEETQKAIDTMNPNVVVISKDSKLNQKFNLFEDEWKKTCSSNAVHSAVSLKVIGDFVTKIPLGYNLHSGWSGMVDITLSGRYLEDEVLASLFDAMSGQGILQQVRILQLSKNKMHFASIKSLLFGLFPIEGAKDDYFFDEELKIKDVPQVNNLTVLDLSFNE